MSKLSDKFKDFSKLVKVQDLKPPQPAIIEEVPKQKVVQASLDEIEFQKIANSSEFKRLVYLIWFGKTHRGKSNDLERQLVKRKDEITTLNRIGRGTHQDFREVVNELEEALAKRKRALKL